MKLKRVLAILLALCMILPLAACSGNGDSNTTTTVGDSNTTTTVNQSGDEPVVGDDTTTTAATDENGETVTTTVATDAKGNVITTTTKKGATTTTVRTKKTNVKVTTATVKPSGEASNMGKITIKEGDTPVEKGLNFGGKTFTYAHWGSNWSDEHTEMYANFGKQYNAKLDVRGIPYTEYVASVSSAMAGGEAYDVLFLYSFDYPAQITANVMVPLNDYITTADLWDEDSATTGGFSESLMQAMSLNGNLYCVAGNYMLTPTVLCYNKKMFADAGYDGSQDPLALYKAGKWSWDALYDMLSDIVDRDKGLWGINSIAPYYEHQFINSYDTDYAKLTSDGRMVQNLSDPNLYAALEMLQKYSYGEQKVTDPNNPNSDGYHQFLNGTTASFISRVNNYYSLYEDMQSKTYSAFGSKAQQLSNLGVVPIPNKNGVYSIWDWMGYGAGNGTSEDGVLCALALAKYDSIHNHNSAYHPKMPADMKELFCSILDSDKLRGPIDGFNTSAGSMGNVSATITSAVALKGQNIAVVLRGYEKVVTTVLDQALKG